MRIGIFDLETTGLEATNSIVLCMCCKELGKKKVTTISADRFRNWKSKKSNNKPVIEAIIEDLYSYDVLIAHNGNFFDRSILNSLCLKYDIDPILKGKKLIDPFLIAKRHLRLKRNSLAALAQFLEIEDRKTPIDFGLWQRAAFDSDIKAMKSIIYHCRMDIIVLESVYNRITKIIGDINSKGSAF